MQTTEYVTTTENYGKTAEVRREFFKGRFPTATGVIVAGLLREGALIEISAIAVLPDHPLSPLGRGQGEGETHARRATDRSGLPAHHAEPRGHRPGAPLRGAGARPRPGRRGGPELLRDVMQAYPIGWLHPETDYIASFPPLNNLPTQYRITVRGEQRWFAQCGFEATSATWLFPGETVRVDAPCLDCGDPVTVEMRDGRITWVDPPEVVGHLAFGFGPSRGRPYYL